MKTLSVLFAVLVSTPALAAGLDVTGAGATFPYPLYSKWFAEYGKAHPEVRFNYQSIGSGGGVQQVIKGTVDFGASDAPMTDEELAKAPDVVHLPTVLGAVAVTFNAPVTGLKLTSAALSGIFLGTVTKWNDAAIASANPGAKLPDQAIAVIHRSDGSGTTAIFTDYLAKVSPEWKSKVGAGKSVKWPAGLGAKGNEGVTGLVKETPGAIGYVELAYATQNKLPVSQLKNRDGQFVAPTIASASEAAAGVQMPDDFRVSITDAKGAGSYPIAAFTYLLVHKDQGDHAKGEAVLRFMWWAIHDGQALAGPLDYAPLPKSVVAKEEQRLKAMTAEGKTVSFGASR